MKVSNYSNIQQIGSRYTQHLFTGPVVIQEKVDGSQFSFANVGGALFCRSKNNEIGNDDTPGGMFSGAIATAKRLFDSGFIVEGMVVRGEVLSKPKHNVLAYGRVPKGNVIIYDIEIPERSGNYQSSSVLSKLAEAWDLETVPTFFCEETTPEAFQRMVIDWLARESVLGGTKIEGVVIKNYAQRDQDDNILMGKFVSAQFKEKMTGKPHSDKLPIVDQIISEYGKEAIWQKAVQHMRDDELLTGDMKDIGKLVAEIKEDFAKENGQDVRDRLVAEYYKEVERGILMGFPQWYKQKLLEEAQ